MNDEAVLNAIKRMRMEHLRHGGDPKKIKERISMCCSMVADASETKERKGQ